MNFYPIAKAIYLTARFQVVGSKDKRAFADFQSIKFFSLVRS